ncbi:glycosyltransferase family 4 protein [Piscinibacter koreensis]|uniref:Glycosyltransferase family 4 protein n=1 Tax=Piscinibacter koreensis TaxID=2742824 RepID=A0A7Y6TVL7_9BURK|nr:glycosyltransferase family 4 protein [Schlegelella koreensis]NUZ05148.1 glycosyltransferase family 4 protein [Schlegelella koreensis]
MKARLRTLLFSTLFPSSVRPVHGIFVETRLRELLNNGEVETKVIAPVPWFFSTSRRFGEYGRIARTPVREWRNGIDVLHPRYPLIPKIGMTVAPLLLAAASIRTIRGLIREGYDFDLIDAHYYYPDGVAAAILARYFHKPFTITARGTDLNLIPKYTLPRHMMQWAARRAAASIGVCDALVQVLRGWGIDDGHLHVMRNGVDLQRFQPVQQGIARENLRLGGSPLILSVGHLIERKGHHLVVEAMAQLVRDYPDATLLIVGEGEERSRLEQQVVRLNLQSHVCLAGAVPNEQLPVWYSAADMLVLASSREGWANVLLESMACGTPVVATDVGGTAEVMAPPRTGQLVPRRDAHSVAQGIRALLANPPSRVDVRRYAECFSWSSTSRSQVSLFRSIVAS